MQLSKNLFLPNIEKIEQELKSLSERARIHGSEKSFEFVAEIERKLSEIRDTHQMVASLPLHQVPHSEEWRKIYRQLKLDVRFAHRQWGRILSNESRFRKLKQKEKREHVPSFAA